MSQAWGRASVAALAHHNEATYYTNTGGARHCAQTGTTLCGHPDDKWGWAVLAGAEIKLDMLSPGSRIGCLLHLRVRRHPYERQQPDQPRPVWLRQQVAFGVSTDAVYVNGGQLQLTTTWSAGGGFEYFWTRNFSSTIYGGYTASATTAT